MKWFQVDADTPNDPKIRTLVRELGAEGVGGLFLVWCHIADHGERKPGWSVDSAGHPIPEDVLIDVSTLDHAKWDQMIAILLKTGHMLRSPWEKRRIIALPAMSRRADTYTKRTYRKNVAPSSKDVRRMFVYKQTNKQTNKQVQANGGIATPRLHPPSANARNSVCPHKPRCSTRHACIERTLAAGRKAKAK